MGGTFSLSEIVDDIIDNHVALKLRNGNKAYITYNNVGT